MDKLILPAAASGSFKPGQIYLANEGAVNNQFLSEALTQFSVGWKSPDGGLEALIRLIFGEPIVVSKSFQFSKGDDKAAFYACEGDEDIRAMGSDFKLVQWGSTKVDSHTLSKGLTTRIDRDKLNDDPEAEQKAVAMLRTFLMRADILRGFNSLSNAASNTNKTWGTGDNKADADADVMAMLIACAKAAGLKPNQVLYGITSWQKRFLTQRDSNNTPVAASATLTPEQLAGLFGVKTVKQVEQIYQNGASKAAMIDNLVLAYNVQGSGLDEDPSNIKQFVTHMGGGSEYAVYREEHGAFVDLTVAHQNRIVVTSTTGIGKLTIS